MRIFNSLGSNYDFSFVIKHLFAYGWRKDYDDLKNKLSEHFGGEAFLFYKGREALRQALFAADLPDGSSVAINGFTCYAVDEAVTRAGYRPVYLDIDGRHLHFTANTLRQAVRSNKSIKAVIIQNTLGYACDIKGIEKVCRDYKLVLIEDLAHSLGLRYADGREAGTVGDYVMLSFGRDKVIDAVSGGALIVRGSINKKWVKNLVGNYHQPTLWQRFVDRTYPLNTWLIRVTHGIGLGKVKQVILRRLGLLPRATDGDFDGLTDLPNSYAREIRQMFARLDLVKIHRQKISKIYQTELDKSLNLIHITGNPVELRFPLKVRERSGLLKFLKKSGINIADIWYDVPIAPPRFMDKTAYSKSECPVSEKLCQQLVNLPTHINISEDKAHYIARKINEFAGN